MLLRFHHQENAGGTDGEAAIFLGARPDRRVFVLQVEIAELEQDEQVRALAVLSRADQSDVALAGFDTRDRDPRRVDAGSFLAHEGARGSGDAVYDGDIAGEQIRELRQKQCRPKVVHQPFVEKDRTRIVLQVAIEDGHIDGDIAFAAAGGNDHVHAAEDFLVALHAGGIQRKSCGVGADALPGFHLALVALFRDLGVEADRRERVHDVGRKALVVDIDALGIERIPMRIQPLAKRGHDADAGDPDFLAFAHCATACSGKPILLAIASMYPRKEGSGGKGARPKVISALHFKSLPTRPLALVTAKPEPSCSSFASIVSNWPGLTNPRILASFTIARNGIRSNFSAPRISQPELCAIASVSSTPGMIGKPGKWPSKIVWVCGTCASTTIVLSSRLRSTMRSMSWK